MNESITVYCVVGYPGSGKSEATAIAEELGYTAFSMGEDVKRRARSKDELGEEADSDEIGNWATRQREKHGKGIVAEWTLERISSSLSLETVSKGNHNEVAPERVKNPLPQNIVIDGVRSIEALQKFEQMFADVRLLYISAPRWLRLLRLKKRGRDGEESFTLEDLEERDEREDDWGVKNLLKKRDVIEIENTTSLTVFQEKIREVLRASK